MYTYTYIRTLSQSERERQKAASARAAEVYVTSARARARAFTHTQAALKEAYYPRMIGDRYLPIPCSHTRRSFLSFREKSRRIKPIGQNAPIERSCRRHILYRRAACTWYIITRADADLAFKITARSRTV